MNEEQRKILDESTRVAQEAAKSIGGSFETGKYTPPTNFGTITGDNLASPPQVELQTPQEQPAFPVQSLPTEFAPTQPEQQATDLTGQIQSLNEQLLGQSTARTQGETRLGVPELQKTQAELAGQLKILQAEQQAIPLQIEQESVGRSRTAAGVAPLQTARLRENAIKALTTSALLQASQGQLATALDQVDRSVDQQFGPLREEIAVKERNLELLLKSPEFSRAEKQRAQTQLDAQRAQKIALDREEDNRKIVLNTATTAARNGADALTLKRITESTDPVEAVRNAGGFLAKPTLGGGMDETTQTYAQLLAEGKITLANVPQNIRNAVVLASGGVIRKPLSDTAIKEVQQSESAISNLTALKSKVEQNLQFVGPVRGLARFNPFSRARQVQAEIDRVKQQVGKTLEGGVLRKEDEEKYKKILATLSDTPETAIYKIDSLITAIQRDIESYKDLQEETGRFVPETGKKSAPEDLRKKYNY